MRSQFYNKLVSDDCCSLCDSQVETPDRMGRESILKVHVSKKELPLGDDVSLIDVANMTTGFTG